MGFTLEIGQKAPDFNLPGTDQESHSFRSELGRNGIIIAFTCNHCPYVIGSEERINQIHQDYSGRGIPLVAINSNAIEHYPEDDFPSMIQRARDKKFKFAYLRDETQEVAGIYGAIKTPHFFVFNKVGLLVYRGRLDDHPKDSQLATTHELRDALEELLEGRPITHSITEPIGCTIKWKGKEKHFIPQDVCDVIPVTKN